MISAANIPKWSVMIPTKDCAHFLEEALASVLIQDPGAEEMQICVVDDASDDDPAAVAERLGHGRVEFFRQAQNVGHTQNFNTCITLARGRLVHILHGDDAVLPGFYAKMGRHFDEHPTVGAAFCRQFFTDPSGAAREESARLLPESGILPDAARIFATRPLLSPPAMVVRRDVYSAVGGFDVRFTHAGEDLEMWVRIAAQYPIAFELEPLVLYRRHPESLLSSSIASGLNIREARTAVSLLQRHFPRSDWPSVDAKARELIALWAMSLARNLARRGQLRAALVQAREAIRTRSSGQVFRHLAALPPALLAGILSPRATGDYRVASTINSP